jgi:hypothetical protein
MQDQVKKGAVFVLALFGAVVIFSQPQFGGVAENQEVKKQETATAQQAEVQLKEVTFAISGMV